VLYPMQLKNKVEETQRESGQPVQLSSQALVLRLYPSTVVAKRGNNVHVNLIVVKNRPIGNERKFSKVSLVASLSLFAHISVLPGLRQNSEEPFPMENGLRASDFNLHTGNNQHYDLYAQHLSYCFLQFRLAFSGLPLFVATAEVKTATCRIPKASGSSKDVL
jgi:hypothetical protein